MQVHCAHLTSGWRQNRQCFLADSTRANEFDQHRAPIEPSGPVCEPQSCRHQRNKVLRLDLKSKKENTTPVGVIHLVMRSPAGRLVEVRATVTDSPAPTEPVPYPPVAYGASPGGRTLPIPIVSSGNWPTLYLPGRITEADWKQMMTFWRR
jgi:hypothetical protein